MYFSSMADFIAMGGYGAYVWSAFGITFAALLWLVVAAMQSKRKLMREIEQKIAREQRVKKAQAMENTL